MVMLLIDGRGGEGEGVCGGKREVVPLVRQ